MAQFDVYENPNDKTNQTVPYLLDLQADLLDNLATRVVAPLVAAAFMDKGVKHLNPRFKVKDNAVFMSTAELAGIPISALGERVGSLKEQRHEIIAALDFIFTGF
jgi:toxin CcdB